MEWTSNGELTPGFRALDHPRRCRILKLHQPTTPLSSLITLSGWNELLIASFSHRSIDYQDTIVLATGLMVHRNQASGAGVGAIFDRVLTELVGKMREMKMDRTELGCLRAIILFNPGNQFDDDK